MLPLFLAAAVLDTPAEQRPRAPAVEPALASVRIVRGAEVRFGKLVRLEASLVREAVVRDRDGSTRPASLIEFY